MICFQSPAEVEPTPLHGSDEIDLNDEEEDAADTLLQNTKQNNIKHHVRLDQDQDDDDDDDNNLFKSTMDKSFQNKVDQSSLNNKPYPLEGSSNEQGDNQNAGSTTTATSLGPSNSETFNSKGEKEAATLSEVSHCSFKKIIKYINIFEINH